VSKIRDLAEKSGVYYHDDMYYDDHVSLQRFAELIIQDTLKLIQQEWYDLNNDEDFDVVNRSNGDIRFRAGQKAELVVIIEKIKKHFGVENE
jgi:hypothetical protein